MTGSIANTAKEVSGDVAPYVLSVNRYLPVAVLYFFFNSVGLPGGLFYTTLLSPLFAIWLYVNGKRWLTAKFLLCLLPFAIVHLHNGVDSRFYYARSSLLLWTVFITTYALYWGLVKCKTRDRLFDQLIVLNFWAATGAVALLVTPLRRFLWNDSSVAIEGADHVLRLALLTSEPSVYAQLMAPLLVYAVLRSLQNPVRRNAIYVAMIAIPFLLAQSFGGLAICGAGIGIAVLVSLRRSLNRRRVLSIVAPVLAVVVVMLAVPNPISLRFAQVIAGTDTSTQSRTTSGYLVAYAVAEPKSLWWGAGQGQAKLTDVSMLDTEFKIGVIPNSVAGTFAELGIIAVVVKFAFEFFLFFRTKVFGNTFRLAIYVIVFLYQFTGSTLTNVQEYLLWAMAFGPLFKEFESRSRVSKSAPSP